ncbi:MAG TPA: MJ0042-type zinc finger domain-containing protein, partial [Candidatus Synoicihabitans sp.]|nr:MJ0042-type zinc finger domain-containing protein [Candidatus Synoicihabitans sp.]
MLTQCPSCQTTFRVTSEILRVAYGQVRCGRCQTQFDATERLLEETDDGITDSGRYMRQPRQMQPPPPPPGQIDVDEPIEHEDITLEGRHIEISGVYSAINETGSGEPLVREETVEEWVEIDEDDATEDVDPEADELQEYSELTYGKPDQELPGQDLADDDYDPRRPTAETNYADEDEDLLRAAAEIEAEKQARL